MDPRELDYVFYGWAAAWTIVLVGVLIIALRERKLRQELDRVRKMVEDSGKP